jgi:hypothetical protein
MFGLFSSLGPLSPIFSIWFSPCLVFPFFSQHLVLFPWSTFGHVFLWSTSSHFFSSSILASYYNLCLFWSSLVLQLVLFSWSILFAIIC